jgi:uncharacterized protein (DUF111 family)
MKKGRPGLLLSVQTLPADADALEAILFQETTTLGVRRQQVLRTVLARAPLDVTTKWGTIAGKMAYLPDGSTRFAPEFEACHQAAVEHGVSLAVVISAAQLAFRTVRTSIQ